MWSHKICVNKKYLVTTYVFDFKTHYRFVIGMTTLKSQDIIFEKKSRMNLPLIHYLREFNINIHFINLKYHNVYQMGSLA